MEQKRRKFFTTVKARQEEKERLARIAQASPPPASVDEEDDVLEVETAVDDDSEDVDELGAAPPVPRRGGFTIKAAHRQVESGDTRGQSWWTKVKPGEMTQTAKAEIARMANTREGRRASRQISDEGE